MAEYTVTIQQHKIDSINSLKDSFKDVNNFIFTDYRGLTVEQITELRGKLREESSVYKVIKNRFAKLALKEMGLPIVDEYLIGPTAIALPTEEAGPVAKILFQYVKDGLIKVKGGIIDGEVFDEKNIEAYSKLPTKSELLSKLMATMKAPVQGIVYILNGVPEKLVRTLQAVADKKGEEK